MFSHFVFAALLAVGFIDNAAAQDRGAWFKSLMQPDNPQGSCCDVADCHEVKADYRAGQWWAETKTQAPFTAVPPAKVLKNKHSIDGAAYLCNSQVMPNIIYCFVPPNMGF